jgi:hypothetical protein
VGMMGGSEGGVIVKVEGHVESNYENINVV